MSKILLSINPEYSNRILEGTKKYEFRRRIPQKKIEKIIIYSTAPEMKVVGEVMVLDIISLKKTPLWEKTKKYSGISRKKYRKYFEGCEIAYAYVLGNVTKFDSPRDLLYYNIKFPPQSFVYIPD